MDEVLKTIQEALERKGLTAAAASRAAVDNPSLIKNMMHARGESPRYSYQALQKLAEVLDLELYFGPPRESGSISVTEVEGKSFAAVARYDAKAAAGGGAINFDDPPIDYLAFSKGWLEAQEIRASSAVLLTVAGDSMSPTLNHGDLVMIDRSRTKLRSGHVYVFNDPENGTRLKRLEVLEGAGIVIRSDSPDQEAHPPEFRAAEAGDKIALGLIGEVVWSAHTWS